MGSSILLLWVFSFFFVVGDFQRWSFCFGKKKQKKLFFLGDRKNGRVTLKSVYIMNSGG